MLLRCCIESVVRGSSLLVGGGSAKALKCVEYPNPEPLDVVVWLGMEGQHFDVFTLEGLDAEIKKKILVAVLDGYHMTTTRS